VTDDRDSFERAFVAISYALDRRGDDLLAPLAEPGVTCRKLATALAHPERSARAVVLAREIARVAQALEARRIG
jgi:hypothetical protein